jgi:hypothetical protein
LNNENNKRLKIIFIVVIFLALGMIAAILVATRPMPIALLSEYKFSTIWQEGKMMNDCAECHDGEDFHSCETCHDDHGAVELANVTFFEVIEFTGDVPDPSFIRVNAILPDQENLGMHITLFEFLSQNGVIDFETVSFFTNDGGLTTIEKRYLDETAMLVPYIDGVRFITESVHSSTWLKGITRIHVVGKDKPLRIDSDQTSIGRLLLKDTTRLTVEGSDVMLTNDSGETSHAFVANWVEGVPLLPLLANPQTDLITITTFNGEAIELSESEIQGAVLAIVRDEVTLILSDRGRSTWPTEIVAIESN